MTEKRKPGQRSGNTIERREKIAQLLRTLGIYGIRRQATSLAQQFGVSRFQIQEDLRLVLKGIPDWKKDEIIINFKIGIEAAKEECQRIMTTSSDEKTRLMATRTLVMIEKDSSEVMERWGLKPIVANKVEHSGESVIKIVGPEWWGKKKDGSSNKDGDLQPASETTIISSK